MELVFDISQDELPIFLAETEEHLQTLDEGLIRLERQDYEPDLLQQIFRAAHTLKGSAGMIGHQRLVELTHTLEMAFDALRKNELVVNSHLVDLCLDSVDGLRLLRDEVVQGQTSAVDVKRLVDAMNEFIRQEKASLLHLDAAPANAAPAAPAAAAKAALPPAASPSGSDDEDLLLVHAKISPKSIASAARAFQLMLALIDLGEVVTMHPSQEQIETAAPVAEFSAELKTERPLEQVRKVLGDVPEIDWIEVGSKQAQPSQTIAQPTAAGRALALEGYDDLFAYPDDIALRMGDFLVSKGYVKQSQLDQALAIQVDRPEPKLRIGRILVELGYLSVNTLESAIADLISLQRKEIQNLQQSGTSRTSARMGEKTIRTSVERLDSLMNLVGELITDRNRLYKIRNNFEAQMRGREGTDDLMEAVTHIGRITDQLQEEVMRIRMLPISNVFNKFPRMLRDLSQKVGKDIQLVIQGQDTELDRSVIEEINDPLIHLLRNSIDHGIEPPEERLKKGKPAGGTIRLTARHDQGQIVITVEDDGRGIDVQKLKQSAVQKGYISEGEAAQLDSEKAVDLIFISGVSTAQRLTEISGRGVGMDIVRSNIEKINGSILVDTKPGEGTRFQIILPLTLAIVPTLLVRVGGTTFAIPLTMVTETLRVKPDDTYSINMRPVILLRNQVLPLMKLGEVFGVEMDAGAQKHAYVVVVSANKLRIGLVVDALIGEEEVVVKSLGGLVGEVNGISSAAILGDGQVSLIIDVPGLFKLADIH